MKAKPGTPGKASKHWLASPVTTRQQKAEEKVCINIAVNLNRFYCMFDQCDYTREREELMAELIPMTINKANLELQSVEVDAC